MEEKIKTLKKRNAELAAIARRLEEKAKHLQQENMKVAILLTLFGRGMQCKLKPTGKYCCHWSKPIIFLVSPLAKQLNESKFEVIISF